MNLEKPEPTVLIVDDDESTRFFLRIAFEAQNFIVAEANSGPAGIQSFEKTSPSVIVVDYTMPGMDGIQCCEKIRALEHGQRIPIIMLSGNADPHLFERARHAGVDRFVIKPADWIRFAEEMRILVDAKSTDTES